MKASNWGRSFGWMTGYSGFGGACILARTSSESVSAILGNETQYTVHSCIVRYI